MKCKKLVGLFLAMTMIFGMVMPMGVQAAYSDNVLFEYDFEDYTGGAPSASGTGVTLGFLASQSATNKVYAGQESNGNTYLYSDFDAYCTAANKTSWSNVGINLVFADDFVTTGKIAVSFDLSRKDLAATTPSGQSIAVRMSGSSNPLRVIAANATDGKFYGYKGTNGQTIDTDGTNGGPLDFELNTKHRVEVVFDIDNDTVDGYIDGKLLTHRTDYTGDLAGKTLQFRMEHETPYFDNLKVAKITSSSFETEKASYAENTLDISFTETLLEDSENAIAKDDFTVTDAVTGEVVTVESYTKAAYDTVSLTFADGALRKGTSYNVSFSSDVKNIAGNTVAAATSFTVPAEEKIAYNEEFAEFTNEDITLTNYEDMKYEDFSLLWATAWKNWSTHPFKAVEAVDDGSDDKAIKITRGTRGTATETHSDVRATLPHNIYFEGDVTIEYRVKLSEDINAFRAYLIGADAQGHQISASRSIPSIWFEGNDVRYSNDSSKNNGTATLYKEDSVDADRANSDYHTYKTVYHFDEETADIYFDGEELATGLKITNYDNIKAKGYFKHIDMRINGANETSYAVIDYVKVTQASPSPYVKSISYEDYEGNEALSTQAGIKKIKLAFAGNIDSSSFTTDTVKLTKNNTDVAYTGEFTDATRTYEITIPGLLAGSSEYALNLTTGVKDTYGVAIPAYSKTITTGAGTKNAPVVTFTEGEEAAAKANIAAGDTITVAVNIIDTTAAKDEMVLIGGCYNSKSLSDVKSMVVNWNECVGKATVELKVDSVTDLNIKALLWKSLSSVEPTQGATILE